MQGNAPARGRSAALLDIGLLGRHQLGAIVATCADFSTMVALVSLAGFSPPVATVMSAIVGGITNFSFSRAVAFHARHDGSIAKQATRYAMVSLGGALLNAALLALVLRVVDVPYTAARAAIAVLVSITYAYPLHTRFVFRVISSTVTPDSISATASRCHEPREQ